MTEQVEQSANDTVISEILELNPELEGIGNYEYGWADSDEAGQSAKRGLDEAVVRDISAKKNEPQWMLDMRLKALKFFERKPMPTWGADLSDIDFDNIKYFVRSTEGQAESWEELPEDIRVTYERLGIPEAERNSLVAGVAAQYESEVVYLRVLSLSILILVCAIILKYLRSTSPLLSLSAITSSPLLILRCGLADHLFTFRRGYMLRSPCRHISALILRTWGSLSVP